MALCPSCGAALPFTLEVREALEAREAAPRELTGVRRPEPLWDTGARASRARREGGWLLWIAIVFAIAAVAAVWHFAPVAQITP